MKWLLYGATGYTGLLIAEEAKRRGLSPVLGGRSITVKLVAERLGLAFRIFGLEKPEGITTALEGISLVLNCAGPFSSTCAPLFEACAAQNVHYLDISGEIETLDYVMRSPLPKGASSMVAIPGVGFDIVPTDCVAKRLVEKLPDASSLTLAYKASASELSGGTYRSVLEGLGRGGKIRRQGKIVDVKLGAKVRRIAFDASPEPAALIPWGDVATAFYSTGIGDIEVYAAMRRPQIWAMRAMGAITRQATLRGLLQHLAGKLVDGPSRHQRETGRNWVWGEVRNPRGQTASLKISTPEGYRFTVLSALAAVEAVLKGTGKRGPLTPSLAFGAGFALTLPEVRMEEES